MCAATSPAIDPLVHGAGHISSFNLAPLGGGQGSGSDLLQKGTQRLREASGAQPEGALPRLIDREDSWPGFQEVGSSGSGP